MNAMAIDGERHTLTFPYFSPIYHQPTGPPETHLDSQQVHQLHGALRQGVRLRRRQLFGCGRGRRRQRRLVVVVIVVVPVGGVVCCGRSFGR